MDEIRDILLPLNVAGWQTGCVYWARYRQTGEVLLPRAAAGHAEDAVRWMAWCGA